MLSQKSFSPSVTVIVILILIVGVYLFNRVMNSNKIIKIEEQKNEASLQLNQVILDSWKIYTNNKYHYTLKYPPELFIEETFDPNGNIDTTTLSNHSSKDFAGGKISPDNKSVFLMFITNPWGEDTNLDTIRNDYKTSTTADIKIGGESGIMIQDPLRNDRLIYLIHNNKKYQFYTKPGDSRLTGYYEKILSTLEFTD